VLLEANQIAGEIDKAMECYQTLLGVVNDAHVLLDGKSEEGMTKGRAQGRAEAEVEAKGEQGPKVTQKEKLTPDLSFEIFFKIGASRRSSTALRKAQRNEPKQPFLPLEVCLPSSFTFPAHPLPLLLSLSSPLLRPSFLLLPPSSTLPCSLFSLYPISLSPISAAFLPLRPFSPLLSASFALSADC
jgi:hypothetical protein